MFIHLLIFLGNNSRVLLNTQNNPRLRVVRVVDQTGIEPVTSSSQDNVLPLNYRPTSPPKNIISQK